nr:hypothetical protein [Lachnospiraceae bacterium]
MDLRKPENEKYLKTGITVVAIVFICMLIGVVIFDRESVGKWIASLFAIVKPFVYGAAIAYLLTPLCNFFEKKLVSAFGEKIRKASKIIAIVLSILAGILLVAGLLLLVIPEVAKSIVTLAQQIPELMEKGNNNINQMLENYPSILVYWQDLYEKINTKLQEWMQTDLVPKATQILSEVAVKISDIVTMLKNAFL